MRLALLAPWLSTAAQATVTVIPDQGCPAGAAIDDQLERLGARELLSKGGGEAIEVRVAEGSLHVSFHDDQGQAIGARVVSATNDCGERAALAAAVIAAFAGDWRQSEPPSPGFAAPPRPAGPAKAVTVVAATAPAAEAAPWRAELGVAAFGLHDGDAGGFGVGGRLDLWRGLWALTALGEGSSERAQALGPGQGAYRFVRAGVGLTARRRWSRVSADATLVPMVGRLALRGKDLATTEEKTDWEFVAGAQARLAWDAGRLRPFLFAGASYDTPAQRMVLRDGSARVPLSRVNVEGGLGIAFGILP